MAVKIDIAVVSKRVPWIDVLVIEGEDLSAATFAMEIRQKPGDTGTAIVALANAASNAQGISCTYNPAYVDPDTGLTFGASLVQMRINEVTMEGLSAATPIEAAVTLAYDLQVTPVGGVKTVAAYGAFVYSPGVTL